MSTLIALQLQEKSCNYNYVKSEAADLLHQNRKVGDLVSFQPHLIQHLPYIEHIDENRGVKESGNIHGIYLNGHFIHLCNSIIIR